MRTPSLCCRRGPGTQFVGQIPAASREEGRKWRCGPRREALGARRRPRGGCWLPSLSCPSEQTPTRQALLNHTLPGNTRDPESHGPHPRHCFPTQLVPFRIPLRPPHRCPGHGKPGRDGQSRAPAHSRGSGSGTGSPLPAPTGLGKAPRAGTVKGGESPPRRDGLSVAGRHRSPGEAPHPRLGGCWWQKGN